MNPLAVPRRCDDILHINHFSANFTFGNLFAENGGLVASMQLVRTSKEDRGRFW